MKTPSLPPAVLRLGFGLAVTLLAGCRTNEPTVAIGISSPPPPLVGSAPIAAYDDYARAFAPAGKVHIEAVAQVGGP